MSSINDFRAIDTTNKSQMLDIATQLSQLSTGHQLRVCTRCLGYYIPDEHKKSNGHSKNRKISLEKAIEISNNNPEIEAFTVNQSGQVYFHKDVTRVVNIHSSDELKSIHNGGGTDLWKTMIFIEKIPPPFEIIILTF